MSHDRYEDFETGEPPFGERHLRPYYAEHMNTLAQSGTNNHLRGEGGEGNQPGPRGARLYPPGLLRCELEEAERIWARLPRWNDLVRARG